MQTLLASQLHALSQGAVCSGNERCHWCSAPCTQKWLHDDAPPLPFQRSNSTAKCPGNLHICIGCWLYRRKRLTVQSLEGVQKDGQCLENYSWWMTEESTWILTPSDYPTLYYHLLCPPLRFSLSFLTDKKLTNLLQCAVANDIPNEVRGDTLLYYTLDNKPHEYTIYELEEALKHGTEGKLPGVRILVDLLGPCTIESKAEKRGRGRPTKEDQKKNESTRIIR